MNCKQKFMAKALLILAGSCVALQAQTSPSANSPQTEKASPAGIAKKQNRDQRKLVKAKKQANQHAIKSNDAGKDEAPSSTPIEYGG